MKDCVDPYTRICAEDGGLVLSLNTSHKFPMGVAMDPHLAFEKCKSRIWLISTKLCFLDH